MVNLDRYIKTDFKIQQFNFKNLNLKFKLKYMNTIAHCYLLTQNFKFFLHDFDVNDIISIFWYVSSKRVSCEKGMTKVKEKNGLTNVKAQNTHLLNTSIIQIYIFIVAISMKIYRFAFTGVIWFDKSGCWQIVRLYPSNVSQYCITVPACRLMGDSTITFSPLSLITFLRNDLWSQKKKKKEKFPLRAI